jgi:hypothetical protein
VADRPPFRLPVDVRPRFRCLVCRRFVEGTDHGTCPQCGWQPPTVGRGAAAAPERAWWLGALLVAAMVGIAYLAL